jgi:glycosyltransferase involved in cell wall biosynthesis
MKKPKILLLSDDMRLSSGVSTMSKELVLGLTKDFDIVQLGAALNHPEIGKVIDLSDDMNKTLKIENSYVKIYPVSGYGDIKTIRFLLDTEKPDAILHFTDPHYWQWLYENEHEIRQRVPILYYHVWDNNPTPLYNKNYYESCDGIFCISKLTYGNVINGIKNVKNKPYVSYVQHGVNVNVFKPLKKIDPDFHKTIHGDKKYDFILFYNNRNIRRKQTSDVILSYKMFCDKLPKKESEKCLLLMHTKPIDENGTNLFSVVNALCPNYDVKFTNEHFSQDGLNQLYNIADCTINIANNEGFGITTVESLAAGTPIIVNVTGGLQDQCGFNVNNVELTADDYVKIETLSDKPSYATPGLWAKAIFPASRSLNGSIHTPYIFEDRVNLNDVAKNISFMYKTGEKNRNKIGLLGREYVKKTLSSEIMCEKMKNNINYCLLNFKNKKSYELIKI